FQRVAQAFGGFAKDQAPALRGDLFCLQCLAATVVENRRLRGRNLPDDVGGHPLVMDLPVAVVDIDPVRPGPEFAPAGDQARGPPSAAGWPAASLPRISSAIT